MDFLFCNCIKKEHIEIINKFMQTDYSNNKITNLAEDLGLKVIYCDASSVESSELEISEKTIYVNNNNDFYSKRFSIAKQISYYILYSKLSLKVEDKKYNNMYIEYLANIISQEILMPIKLIAGIIEKNKNKSPDEIIEFLANELRVSKAMVKLKLNLFEF